MMAGCLALSNPQEGGAYIYLLADAALNPTGLIIPLVGIVGAC